MFHRPKRHPYDQWSPDARALDLVGDKWTLLIVRDLAAGPRRFVELQRVLPGISTEQLRSRLNRMVADEMLTRKRYREVPPRVEYELTERARELMPVLGRARAMGLRVGLGPTARVRGGRRRRDLPARSRADLAQRQLRDRRVQSSATRVRPCPTAATSRPTGVRRGENGGAEPRRPRRWHARPTGFGRFARAATRAACRSWQPALAEKLLQPRSSHRQSDNRSPASRVPD